jgi:hypothetical protein
VGAVVLTTTALLVACGTPPWERGAPTGSATSTTDEATTDAATPPSEPAATGDLAGGNTRRDLTAGAAALTVSYWTDLPAVQWTAAASKPVSLSVSATEPNGAEVYLQRLRAVATALDGTGAPLDAPPAFEDAAAVSPGYLMSDPYSYSTSFTIGALDPTARTIRVDLTYEILQRATPESTDLVKQTAHDTLTLGVVGP